MLEAEAICKKLRKHTIICSICWIALGVLQLIAGLFLWWLLIIGAGTIIGAIIDMAGTSKIIPGNQKMVRHYKGMLPWLIVAMVIHAVLGGLIGIGVVAYQWTIRDSAVKNLHVFEKGEEK